ncbi:MAG: hypothetical protein WA159_09600 [Variovorax sp.]
MHPVITKTFGGLSRAYYIRQLLFGALFPAFIIAMVTSRPGSMPLGIGMVAYLVVSTLLYPYARFVYESVVGYVMGGNVFFVNAFFMLLVKGFTMMLCWCFAIFIAPIGLLWLYVHHSKIERDAS